MRQVKAQKEHLTILEANEEANEEEWLQDNREMNDKMLSKDHVKGDDERELELFWNDRESGEITLWNAIFDKAHRYLLEHKYEIDNHFSVFDWLKIYSEALLDQDLDMNQILKVVESEGIGLKAKAHNRSSEEWTQLGEAAKYLVSYRQAAQSISTEQSFPEMAEFLSKQVNLPGDATHASIWQKALAKKNEFLQEQKAKSSVKRNEIIRSQLADFNRI